MFNVGRCGWRLPIFLGGVMQWVPQPTNFVSSSAAGKLCQQVLQTNFVSSFCRQSLSAHTGPGNPDRQTLQTNFVCMQKIRRKLGQNADKLCRQTLSTLKIADSC